MTRAIGMVLFVLLGSISGVFAYFAVHGAIIGSSLDGWPPFSVFASLLTGLPCLLIWRFMIR